MGRFWAELARLSINEGHSCTLGWMTPATGQNSKNKPWQDVFIVYIYLSVVWKFENKHYSWWHSKFELSLRQRLSHCDREITYWVCAWSVISTYARLSCLRKLKCLWLESVYRSHSKSQSPDVGGSCMSPTLQSHTSSERLRLGAINERE